ncbi:MAG TPA: hypothetical protein VMV81_02015 [Phycisphaerae bacterium]|nr:hypothetical protein [Phycisphaerae bacterium]
MDSSLKTTRANTPACRAHHLVCLFVLSVSREPADKFMPVNPT